MNESSGWEKMARFWLRNIQEGVAECELGEYVTPCWRISGAGRFERTRCVPAVPQRGGQGGGRTVRRPAHGGKRTAFCGKFEAKARVLQTGAGTTQGQYDS